MIFSAQSFSDFEFCPRRPQLARTFEPPQWPIREAVKHFFESGIRGIMAGESPELTVQSFLVAAASPGFIYPQGENYTLAQDHASWLDGALRIVKEENPNLEPLPLYQVGEHTIHVEGWQDGEKAHIFKVSSNTSNRSVRWPELVLLAMDGREVTVHSFNLPSVRGGRVSSPLCMAYQHPSFANIQYRLSRLYDQPDFGPNWKKLGRWEIQPQPDWPEWRTGIERDQCIDKIREIYTVADEMEAGGRDRLLFDIEAICVAMERPTIYPRLRETCQRCIFNGLCHGTPESRKEYKVADKTEIERFAKLLSGDL